MQTIYKYTFDVRDLLKGYRAIVWTMDSKLVHSTYDNPTGQVTLWVQHSGFRDANNKPQFPFMKHYLLAVGTGWDIPEETAHLCTVITDSGYVWHIFKAHNIVEGS